MEQILILDFGSQYTQLIARRLRNLGVYCEILPFHSSAEEILKRAPRGIILSGGPSSVYDKKAPKPDFSIFNLGIPLLGICYGMQLMAHELGGKVRKAGKREYGLGRLKIRPGSKLLAGLPAEFNVWLSHGDEVKTLPRGFALKAGTKEIAAGAMESPGEKLYAVQFHPEVHHTEHGSRILANFAGNICGCRNKWSPVSFLPGALAEIKKTTSGAEVVCALSGGVDSSVAAVMVHRAVGKRLHCIFVDTGLLRHGDRERMKDVFSRKFGFNLTIADASKLFLSRLAGVSDPEKKRKVIGHAFIEIFEKEAKKIKNARFLVQGTLYPDVIGRSLKIPEAVLMQHPFPGPGLAIRVLGAVTAGRLEILRAADSIMRAEIEAAGWYGRIWQAFCVLLPIKTVGVMGDERSYENVLALRCVGSVDGMTADWSKIPHELLQKISSRIISEVRGVNRVVYDITSKPPATIEWE